MDFKCLIVMVAYNTNCGSKWLRAWQNGFKYNSKLAVIHNEPEKEATQRILSFNPDVYIKRENIGLDLGVFQDIVKERLELPKWDWLLQFTYDTVPMCKEWLNFYYNRIDENIGLIAGKPAWWHGKTLKHIRTTGFMISKKAAQSIKFPADPMRSQQDCWSLEHGKFNIMNQVIDHGFLVTDINPKQPSRTCHVIWDCNTEGDFSQQYLSQFRYQKKHRLI